jgi:predicted component of type VI protein secretion system
LYTNPGYEITAKYSALPFRLPTKEGDLWESSMSYLVVRNSDGNEHRVALMGAIVLGRSVKCDVWLQDPALSREHCQIESNGDGWSVVDLNSRNGTYIGPKSIQRHELNDGDVIRVGSLTIAYFAGTVKPARAEDPFEAQHTRLMAASEKQAVSHPPKWMAAPQPRSRPMPVHKQPEPGDDEIVSPYSLPFMRPRPTPIVNAVSRE